MRTNVLQTYSNGHYEFQLLFWVYNQIYICASVDASTLAKKEVFLFLNKHVKFEKKGMCCGIYVHSIGEWGNLPKNATTAPALLFGATTFTSIAMTP